MRRPGLLGWIGLAAYILVWDLTAPETLTSTAQRNRLATAIVGAVVLAHLLDLLPPSIDPFYLLDPRRLQKVD